MSPKKSIEEQLRARLSPVCEDPAKGGNDDPDELDPPLNHRGAQEIVKIIGPPSGNEKYSVSGFASASSTRFTAEARYYFIMQQSAQQEHLK